MPVRLSTTVKKIASLPNSTNAVLMTEFYQYMKNNGASEIHTNNNLKTNMALAQFLGRTLPSMISKEKKILLRF
jgi:integrase/recombinase XerD